jgi:hypothetical protein
MLMSCFILKRYLGMWQGGRKGEGGNHLVWWVRKKEGRERGQEQCGVKKVEEGIREKKPRVKGST